MDRNEFMIQQYLTLRDEIRRCKARSFWLMIVATVMVPTLAFIADQYSSTFAGASLPFVILVLMLAFMVEQNDMIRAGRFVRERIEPEIAGAPGWEEWLESNHEMRSVDKLFFGSLLIIFLLFYAISTRIALESVFRDWGDTSARINIMLAVVGYIIGGLWFVFVLFRHWNSCTTTRPQ